MPKRKKESAAAVTRRSRKFRARKRLRKLISEHDSFVALDLIQYSRAQRLDPGTWIVAAEFFSSYLPENQAVFLAHEFSGVESAVARIGGALVKLIRPKL